jgi:hypothetical protein
MRLTVRSMIAVIALAAIACDDAPMSPDEPTATVRIVFAGSTTRDSDLPASAQACLNGVGPTHTHPSWQNFAAVPLQAVPPARYEITFTDVPIGTRVSFRINDQNFCDENATGAVTRNVFANDVQLVQNTTTPGSGTEPGYAITVSASGAVTQ